MPHSHNYPEKIPDGIGWPCDATDYYADIAHSGKGDAFAALTQTMGLELTGLHVGHAILDRFVSQPRLLRYKTIIDSLFEENQFELPRQSSDDYALDALVAASAIDLALLNAPTNVLLKHFRLLRYPSTSELKQLKLIEKKRKPFDDVARAAVTSLVDSLVHQDIVGERLTDEDVHFSCAQKIGIAVIKSQAVLTQDHAESSRD